MRENDTLTEAVREQTRVLKELVKTLKPNEGDVSTDESPRKRKQKVVKSNKNKDA